METNWTIWRLTTFQVEAPNCLFLHWTPVGWFPIPFASQFPPKWHWKANLSGKDRYRLHVWLRFHAETLHFVLRKQRASQKHYFCINLSLTLRLCDRISSIHYIFAGHITQTQREFLSLDCTLHQMNVSCRILFLFSAGHDHHLFRPSAVEPELHFLFCSFCMSRPSKRSVVFVVHKYSTIEHHRVVGCPTACVGQRL